MLSKEIGGTAVSVLQPASYRTTALFLVALHKRIFKIDQH